MEPALRAWVREVRRIRDDVAADGGVDTATAQVLADLARAVAAHLGIELSGGCRLLVEAPAARSQLAPPASIAGPGLLGAAHEALAASGVRGSRGVHYTPVEVARRLVDRVLTELQWSPGDAPPAFCDPSVGGGVFLLAAADRLAAAGAPPRRIVDECLFGADVDPLAVAVTEAALALWAGDGRPPPSGSLLAGDGLALEGASWPGAPAAGFDAVVGNPPFLGQLARATVRTAADRARASSRFGAEPGAYTDTAALFLLAGVDLVRRGGVVALLQPESVLAARDAAGVRAAVATRAPLRSLWLGGSGLFDAGVRVCAPLLVSGAEPGDPVEVLGPGGEPVALASLHDAGAWAQLLASADGVPEVTAARVGGRLGDRFAATAGFRDEYYGLVGHVAERGAAGGAPLVTTGLIDPGACHWGRRPVRFAGRSWTAPVVAAEALAGDDRVAGWLRRMLVPKIVVAPQTKVVEAAVDETGDWVPCTPVIVVTGPPDRLWHTAAALCGPVASAWVARQAAGTGLGSGTVRVRARQLVDAPLPPDGPDLDRAAAALRAAASAGDGASWRAALLEVGSATCRAHGIADEGLLAWWAARLPAWR